MTNALLVLGSTRYTDIGQERYETQFKERTLKSLARKAKALGLQLVPLPESEVP